MCSVIRNKQVILHDIMMQPKHSGPKIYLFTLCSVAEKVNNPNFLQRFIPIPFTPPIFAMSSYIIPSMAQKDSHKDRDGGQVGVITRTEPKTKKPSLYKVLLLNDDYTPMEFVVHVLQVYFAKSAEEATRIMLHVHQKGVGICGVYTFEIAETKVTQVMDFAKKHQQPLQCTMEKE